jgi:hypothetical protein
MLGGLSVAKFDDWRKQAITRFEHWSMSETPAWELVRSTR